MAPKVNFKEHPRSKIVKCKKMMGLIQVSFHIGKYSSLTQLRKRLVTAWYFSVVTSPWTGQREAAIEETKSSDYWREISKAKILLDGGKRNQKTTEPEKRTIKKISPMSHVQPKSISASPVFYLGPQQRRLQLTFSLRVLQHYSSSSNYLNQSILSYL